jgi:cytochrome c biogenesis protein CcdA
VELLGPLVTIGLLDSLNPATIALAAFLALGERPVPRLAAYVLGVFTLYFAGGVLLTLGPAALVAHLLRDAHGATWLRVTEMVVGVCALAVGAWMWRRPPEQVARSAPTDLRPAAALGLGATVTAIDLPTAFPLLAGAGLIVKGRLATVAEVALMACYCLAYVAPLLAIIVLAAILHARAAPLLERVRDVVSRWAPRVLGAITAAFGMYAIWAGLSG